MRRLLCGLLAFALVLVGATSSVSAKVVLKVYIGYDKGEQPELVAMYERYLAEYQALNPNVTIQNLGKEDKGDKLVTLMATGVAPDIIKCAMALIVDFARMAMLESVPKAMASQIRNNFVPVAVDTVMFEGELVGIPIENNVTALLYNTKLLDEAALVQYQLPGRKSKR